MTDEERRQGVEEQREEFHRQVERKEERSRRAKEAGDRSMRYGFRSFGVIGWTIVVPTLLGIAIGAWLDARAGGGIRFTLSLMAAGLIIGMLNAWNWIHSE